MPLLPNRVPFRGRGRAAPRFLVIGAPGRFRQRPAVPNRRKAVKAHRRRRRRGPVRGNGAGEGSGGGPEFRLPARRTRPRVEPATTLPALVAVSGQASVVSLGSQTPFILERANPSKDGDAKLWAFRRPREGPVDGCQAAEGLGRRRARPSPSVPLVETLVGVRGPVRRLQGGLPNFFSHPVNSSQLPADLLPGSPRPGRAARDPFLSTPVRGPGHVATRSRVHRPARRRRPRPPRARPRPRRPPGPPRPPWAPSRCSRSTPRAPTCAGRTGAGSWWPAASS